MRSPDRSAAHQSEGRRALTPAPIIPRGCELQQLVYILSVYIVLADVYIHLSAAISHLLAPTMASGPPAPSAWIFSSDELWGMEAQHDVCGGGGRRWTTARWITLITSNRPQTERAASPDSPDAPPSPRLHNYPSPPPAA